VSILRDTLKTNLTDFCFYENLLLLFKNLTGLTKIEELATLCVLLISVYILKQLLQSYTKIQEEVRKYKNIVDIKNNNVHHRS